MSEAAWNKAFTHGSRELQNRLKKVHAKNPKFQAWMKSSGHGSGESVKQASKEVKPTARVKTLQAKSLQAYGATKGVKVGGEHGGEEMRDTITPLTRDQHSKVQAAERAAKAAAKAAAPAKPKKPLTQAQRMAAIAAAVRKSKEKHDVATVDPDDADHDDLRDVHQSLHVSRGYNEEVEQIDELKLSDVLKATHGKSPEEKQKIIKAMREKERASKPAPTPRKPEPAKDIPMHMRVYPPDMKYHGDSVELEGTVMNEGKMKDIVTDREETARLKAQDVLGGPVKEKPKMPPGKQPAGYRYVRGLARRAMRGGIAAVHKSMEKTMAKEEVEQIDELKASTLRKYVKAAVDNLGVQKHNLDQEKMGAYHSGEIIKGSKGPENADIRAAHRQHVKMHNAAAKKLTNKISNRGMGIARAQANLANEEVEQVVEQDDSMEKKEMAQTQLHFMAYAAKEILEFIDMGGEIEEWYQNKLSKVQSEVESLHSYIEGEKRRTGMVREEVVTEAEGTVAVTPKQKALAAHHGDPKKITYGDVIKARLKSAAAKKMGK